MSQCHDDCELAGTEGSTRKRVALVVVWLGPWPDWFPYFLKSCHISREIDWLLFSNSSAPQCPPPNVHFKEFSRVDLEQRFRSRLGADWRLSSGYKLCDLKPLYGHLFDDLLNNYDFWGYCDIDVVFGRLQSFLLPQLRDADVLTSTHNIVAGHLTILRNNEELRTLYQQCEGWKEIIFSDKHFAFDEKNFSTLVQSRARGGTLRLTVIPMVSEDAIIWWSGRKRFLIVWYRGRLVDVFGCRPLGYFHFIQTKLKRRMTAKDAKAADAAFVICDDGITNIDGFMGLLFLTRRLITCFFITIPWYFKISIKPLVPRWIRDMIRRT